MKTIYTLDMGDIGEQDVTVEYHTTRAFAGTQYEPPEPAEFVIDRITWCGIDITDDVSEDAKNEFEAHMSINEEY